jgi:hypothetical protein
MGWLPAQVDTLTTEQFELYVAWFDAHPLK